MARMGENVSKMYLLCDKGIISRVYKELLQIIKTNSSVGKWVKGMSR